MNMKARRAFTLVELLVVIAIIGILAALVLPALSRAKATAKRTTCIGNLKQISAAVLMYADDHNQRLPGRSTLVTNVTLWRAYKSLVKDYVGLRGPSSPQDRLFACPADTFTYNDVFECYVSSGEHEQTRSDFSSYGFNAANLINMKAGWKYPKELFGVAGEPDTSIREPSRTVFVGEGAAWRPFSWHQPRKIRSGNYRFNNARCVTSFVDGHVKYIRFYWDETRANEPESWWYDPPAGYQYRCSAR